MRTTQNACTAALAAKASKLSKALPLILLLLSLFSHQVHGDSKLSKAATTWLDNHKGSFQWNLTYRQKGISYLGAAQRLRKLAQRLINGEGINMAALGGSITWGIGVKSQSQAYPGLLQQWLSETFPGPVHTMTNCGFRGITSTYMALCMDVHLPDSPLDLVVAEFAVNDIMHPNPTFAPGSRRAAYERLLRKLLNLPGHPVVIVVNMITVERDMKVGYWENAERDFQEFSTFYGLPTASFKAAAFLAMKNKTPGADVKTLFGASSIKHPVQEGHVLVKDILGTMFQQIMSDFSTGFWKDGPGPLAVSEDEASYALPAPMIKNNYEAQGSLCLMEDRFKERVISAQNWNWTDEGRGPSKWGYVTYDVGAELVAEIDTQVPPEMNRTGRIWVSVAYLKTYELMGTANVTCISGCYCDPVLLEGTEKSRKVSLTHIGAIKVSQHPRCQLKVTVNSRTSSRGHKFKVMGITISKEEGIKGRDGILTHLPREESLDAHS